jgi:hypothetical protein
LGVTTPQDQARADLITWIKSYHARRPLDRADIELRYGLQGCEAKAVTDALYAASVGADPDEAMDNRIEGAD